MTPPAVPGPARPVYSAPREWTRVHPVSPYLGSGPILGFIFLYALTRVLPSWVAGGNSEYEALNELPFMWLSLGAVLVVAAVVGIGVLAWRRNAYRVGDDAMFHRKGIVFRQHTQARLDRIEAVDVVQPLLARLFGLAQLSIQVAGGRGSAIELKFLRLGDAEALRNEVLALAAGAKLPDAVAEAAAQAPQSVGPASLRDLTTHVGETNPVTAVPAAPEHDVLAVPTNRLIASIALSLPTAVVAIAAVALVVAAVIFGSVVGEAIVAFVGTSLFAMVGFVAAVLGFFWNQLNGGFRFTVATSPDGLRLRHGLMEMRRQTVTPGRVQAVVVTQTVLWRRMGWYRISMNVAGYGPTEQRVSTLLPVGTADDVLLALGLVLPDVTEDSLREVVAGHGADNGFTPSPRRAWLLDPLQWRGRGVRAGQHALFIRSGWLTRRLVVVPHERTHSVGVRQGPLQRLRHLATLSVHSTPGPVRPIAEHLDADTALDLLDQQAERARHYRTVGHA